jgi:dTDP-4-dehydrorhamnose reductase
MNLILGDGLLGSAVIGGSGWHFISRRQHGFDINNDSTWRCNIPNGVTCIINLIANTDTYSTDLDDMFETNYRGVIRLVDYCNDKGIKLIHFSTDYVYENSKSNAKETYKTKPTTPYAMSKALADEYIMKHSVDYLILRGSQKDDPFPYESAFTNVYGNFDYPDKIAELVIEMVRSEAVGLYNIGTPIKSMFELAKLSKQDVKKSLAPDLFRRDLTMDISLMEKHLQLWQYRE